MIISLSTGLVMEYGCGWKHVDWMIEWLNEWMKNEPINWCVVGSYHQTP